jgi:hypothetical protein
VRVGDRVYNGRAVSTDIISASLSAYVLALNRAMIDRNRRPGELVKEAV